MRRPLALTFLSGVLLLAGCDGGGGGKPDCSPAAEKQWLSGVLRDWYLYTDLLVTVDPAQPGLSSQAFLDAMTATARAQGKDRLWSYLTTTAASTTFFQEGQAVGFGVSLLARDPDVLVSQVYPGSAAAAAGFARGDELLQIGETEATLAAVTPANVGGLLGPATAGLTRVFQVLPWGAAAPVVRSATKAVFGLDPVPVVEAGQRFRIVDRGGRKLGYVALRTFISPADPLLAQAFQALRTAGVTDVVVDLRYNGGGLISTAELLANLLGGGAAGRTMLSVTNNPARSAQFNETATFAPPAAAVAATRVAFITTGASASASELVPNVLEPYLAPPGGAASIALVGAKTYGKPVGQRGFQLKGCETVAFVVSFRLENAEGEGGYYDGLPDVPAVGSPAFGGPLCAAADDLGNAPGSDAEASTAAALAFLETGACPAPPAAAAKPGLAAAAVPDSYPEAPEPSLAQRHVNGLF